MKGRWTIRPVGVVRSEGKAIGEAPKQGGIAGTEAEIVVDSACAPALTGLKERVRPAGDVVGDRRLHPRVDVAVLLPVLRGDQKDLLAPARPHASKPGPQVGDEGRPWKDLPLLPGGILG